MVGDDLIEVDDRRFDQEAGYDEDDLNLGTCGRGGRPHSNSDSGIFIENQSDVETHMENYQAPDKVDENLNELRNSYRKKFSLNDLFDVTEGATPEHTALKASRSSDKKIVNIRTGSKQKRKAG